MLLDDYIKAAKLKRFTGNGLSTDYENVNRGLLPPPVKVNGESRRSSAWVASEVALVQQARIAGKSDEEIRQLVRQIVANRKGA